MSAIASSFVTLQASTTLSIPHPVGTEVPSSFGYTLVGLDPGNADITGSIRARLLGEDAASSDQSGTLMVDRSRKGDFGFDRPADRTIALKGDRLAPPTDVASDAPRAAALAQNARPATQPPSLAPPVTAQVGPERAARDDTQPKRARVAAGRGAQKAEQPAPAAPPQSAPEPENQGRYTLASAGDYRVVAPKRPAARSAAPAAAAAREDRDGGAPGESLAFASTNVDPTL